MLSLLTMDKGSILVMTKTQVRHTEAFLTGSAALLQLAWDGYGIFPIGHL